MRRERLELTKLVRWRYVRTGILALLLYFAAYCRVLSLILVGTTMRAGYVGENYKTLNVIGERPYCANGSGVPTE
jgi:hypothetical protein